MNLPGNSRNPKDVQLPRGVRIASFANYSCAHNTLEYLDAQGFPVQELAIVGEDLVLVEKVAGKLTHPKVALSGFIGGAWIGLFLVLLVNFAGLDVDFPIGAGIGFCGGLGMILSVLLFSSNRTRRKFTTTSQVMALNYVLICRDEHAAAARQLLEKINIRLPGAPKVP